MVRKDEVAAMREEIAALREELRRTVTEQGPTFNIEKYEGLNENEKNVLTLLMKGISREQAMKAAGVSDSYLYMRLKDSVEFATAYNEMQDEFRGWMEARARFQMPQVWAKFDQIMALDPDAYIDDGHEFYARTVLQSQTRLLQDMLKIMHQRESTVHHTIDTGPMMQVRDTNMALIAEHIRELDREEASGKLKHRLPEEQIIDAEVRMVWSGDEYTQQPVDGDGWTCLECDGVFPSLLVHLKMVHRMSVEKYKEKHHINPAMEIS